VSSDAFTEIVGVEPTYSVRKSAVLLGRSVSWLDQRVRNDDFVLRDGTTVQPSRTPGGYRRFTLAMLKDVALSSYHHGWFSMDELKSTIRELLMAAHRDTGEYEIPSPRICLGSSTHNGSGPQPVRSRASGNPSQPSVKTS
jgi:hypothetical protein